MNNYLLLIFADLLTAGNFAVNNLYQKKAGTSVKAGFMYNASIGLISVLIFFALNGFKINLTAFSVIMAGVSAILCMAYTIIGFKIMQKQGMALYTLFLMTGGMIVPYVWGLMFLGEAFSVLRTVGLLLITVGVIFSKWSKEKSDITSTILCIVVFLLNGFVSVVSKIHSIEITLPAVTETEFIIVSSFFKFVIAGTLCFISKNKSTEQRIDLKPLFIIFAVSAIMSGFSYMMQLNAAKSLPATVVYPFVTGGCIIFSALMGRVFYKEKIKKNLAISICFCFIGTLMFL